MNTEVVTNKIDKIKIKDDTMLLVPFLHEQTN